MPENQSIDQKEPAILVCEMDSIYETRLGFKAVFGMECMDNPGDYN